MGGKLFIIQELDHKQESSNQTSELQIKGIFNSIFKNIGGNVQHSSGQGSSDFDFANKEQFLLSCIGGTPNLMGYPNEWIKSLSNYKNWEVITINSYRFSYDYLDEPVRSNILKLLKTESQKPNSVKPPMTYHLSDMINQFTVQKFVLKNRESPVYLKLESEASLLTLGMMMAGTMEGLVILGVSKLFDKGSSLSPKLHWKAEEILEQADSFQLQKVEQSGINDDNIYFIMYGDMYLQLKDGKSLYLNAKKAEGSIFSFQLLSEEGYVMLRHDNLYLVYNKTIRECQFLNTQEIQQLGDCVSKVWVLQPTK